MTTVKLEPADEQTITTTSNPTDIITINIEPGSRLGADSKAGPLEVKLSAADISEHAYSTVSKTSHPSKYCKLEIVRCEPIFNIRIISFTSHHCGGCILQK